MVEVIQVVGPVRDVAKHEAASVIGQPADHKGYDHCSENKNSVAKRLSTVGLHGGIQDGGISPTDADTVVLLCLAEHSQKLIGYDPVQCRYGHHGYHKGQKRIYLKHCLNGDRGDDRGAYLLAFTHHLAHDEEHRRGKSEGRDPHGADELLGAAAGHDALGFERVANGHVALHAQAGDVERGGVRAAVPEEVVTPADGVPEHPRVVEPDEVVELDGHGEDEDQQVGDSEASQVVVHGALEVLQSLFGQQGVQCDGVPQRADSEQGHVDDCDYHPGVNVRVDFQVFLLRVGSDGGVLKWKL